MSPSFDRARAAMARLEALLRIALPRLTQHRGWLGGAAIGVLLVVVHGGVLVTHLGRSNSRWCFADDARIWIYSLYGYEEPGLFPGDPIVDYMRGSMPDGYRLLYRLLGPLVGVGVLSKALPYALLAMVLASIAAASHRLGGKIAMATSLSLSLGSTYLLARMAGGLPRAFALPFMSAGAACLVYGRLQWLGLLAVLGAAFYPMVGVMLGGCFALSLCLPARDRGTAASWPFRTRLLAVASVGALSLALSLPTVWRMHAWGPAISEDMWPAFPEAGPAGRLFADDLPPFPNLFSAAARALELGVLGAGAPLVRMTHVGEQGAWVAVGFGILAAILWIPLAMRRSEARRLLVLPAAIAACHTVAVLAFPALYVPERYVTYAVVLLALIAIPCATHWNLREVRPRVLLVALAWNAALLGLVGARGSDKAGLTVKVSPNDQPLFRALSKLPRNVVIAGWPDETLDNLPHLTRRSAFVTREVHQPWNTRYVELLRQRMTALIGAYFATSLQPLRDLRDRHHVTHLLVDRDYFRRPPTYFAPFDALTKQALSAAAGSGFAALDAIPRAAVVSEGRYALLDLSKL